MSNLLQYTIQLRDQMSSVLNRLNGVTRSTNNTMTQLQRDALNGARAMRELGVNAHGLRKSLEKLRYQREFIRSSDINKIQMFNREIKLLERQISRVEGVKKGGITNSFSKAFQEIPFSNLLTNPVVLATAGIAKTFSVGMQNEMNKTAFSVLLNSDSAADQLMGDLSKIKMDKNVLGENAKTLLSFGIDQSKIAPMLQSIGDISIGDANRMNSLTLAFSQMSSTGKLMGQDLLQMINAGFNPLNEISKKTGKSIGDLKKDMEKGAISAKMVEGAFLQASGPGGQFENMLNKQASTLSGHWNTWMTKANDKFISFYNLINPIVVKMMDLAEKGFGFVADKASVFFSAIKAGNPWLWGLVTVLGAYVIGMGAAAAITATKTAIDYVASGAIWSQVTGWWSLNAAMYANPVALIIAGVITLIAVLGYVIYKVEGWGKAWSYTVQGAKLMWTTFVSIAKASFNTMVGGIMIGIEKIQIAWYKFKNAIGLGDKSKNNAMIDSLNKSVVARQELIKKSWNNVKNNGAASANAFKNSWDSLSWNNDKKVSDVLRKFKNKIMPSSGIADSKGLLGTTKANGIETSLGGNGKKGAEKTNQATTTGGSKSNYITINLDALIKGLTINSDNSNDSSNQLQNKTTDALLLVLAMASTAGS